MFPADQKLSVGGLKQNGSILAIGAQVFIIEQQSIL